MNTDDIWDENEKILGDAAFSEPPFYDILRI